MPGGAAGPPFRVAPGSGFCNLRYLPSAYGHFKARTGCSHVSSSPGSRYLFKTATSNRKVQLLADGQVRGNYHDSKTARDTSIKLQSLEFMARFLQHILPRAYARVRTFGWLHPAAKIRANRVRALLGQRPVLTPAEEKACNPPPDSGLELPALQTPIVCSAPLCSRCQQPMLLLASWQGAQVILYPKRPP